MSYSYAVNYKMNDNTLLPFNHARFNSIEIIAKD